MRPFSSLRAFGVAVLLAVAIAAPVGSVLAAPTASSPPSRFGIPTSARWTYGQRFRPQSLGPVPNPNPSPEWRPHRDHPFDVAVSSDGTRVYVGLQGSELEPGCEVAVYDLEHGRLSRRLRLEMPGSGGPAGVSPYRLAMHPLGRFLLVTNRLSNFATVIDTRNDTVVSQLPLDFYCQELLFTADGREAYAVNRYLDQVFRIDVDASADRWKASMREMGNLDARVFHGTPGSPGIHSILRRTCGTAGCHGEMRGGFYAGADERRSFVSVLGHVRSGDARNSRLLRAPTSTRHGGYGDAHPQSRSHRGGVVFKEGPRDADAMAIARWIDAAGPGPGIPVGNERSKPKVAALARQGRYLFVGNTGTSDISIVDTRLNREVAGVYVQNVVNDLKVFRSPQNGHEYLLVTTEGIGFGVTRERDPLGAESWDRANPAAHFSVWRDLEKALTLPRERQEVLGPMDAVDGTASVKFRDIQNDILVVDIDALDIPARPATGGLPYILSADRYEAHRSWVRYTSDTAEATSGDFKGDLPPDLMRVVGSLPERMALVGNRLFVTMQGSAEVQEWRVQPEASDPSDTLLPVASHATGLQPIGIASGRPGTPSAGLLFVANYLGGSFSVIDPERRTSREVTIDPSLTRWPVPATSAERGEILAHSAMFSSDRDTSCFHCHYLDMGDGRPQGVSQVMGQEFLPRKEEGRITVGGVMSAPQMRNLFAIQPFFFEGVISAYEPRSMIMEHAPADDFDAETPQGDFTGIEAHYVMSGVHDIQSSMQTSAHLQATLEERRDEMFRRRSMEMFGKAFVLRDFQRFVGEWQVREPRLLPDPFDRHTESVLRGKRLFEDPQVGCVSCHSPPAFARKDFKTNPEEAFPPLTTFSNRDGAFTLIGMNRLDFINGFRRDLEPWDVGRREESQGNFTTFPLRGIWDRPPVFLHNGMGRSLHEVLCVPGHPALRSFRYGPQLGPEPDRPGRREVGQNATYFVPRMIRQSRRHVDARGRIGVDTHGGTSHLTPRDIDDLANFINSLE